MSNDTSGQFLDQFKDQVQNAEQQASDQSQAATGDQQYDQSYYGGYTAEQYQQWYQYYGAYGGNYDYSQYQQSGDASQASGTTDGQQAPAQSYDQSSYYGYNPYSYPGWGSGSSYPPRPRHSAEGEPSRILWLGGIHPDTTENELHTAFIRFGIVENVKVLPTKGCAFVRFAELDAAIQAYNGMYGCIIHGQQVKVGWGKPEPNRADDSGPPPCRNLWLGNVGPEVTEDQVRAIFGKFGEIDKVRIIPAKNCAFVNFFSIESAIEAKRQMQGYLFGDRPLKINFGKEKDRDPLFDPPSPPLIDPPPPEYPPPLDPALKKIIDTFATYVSKNGLAFEEQTREKQKGNPKFSFLHDGGEWNGYYKFKLWCIDHPDADPHVVMLQHERKKQQEQQNPPAQYGSVPPPNQYGSHQPPPPKEFGAVPPPNMYGKPPPPKREDDIDKLVELIDNLVPTKESIKVTKNWIMQRANIAKDIASYIKARVETNPDFEQRLNIIYLIHDVLYNSFKERAQPDVLDSFAQAFLPHLGVILRLTYQDQTPENQEKVTKVLKIWDDKKIFFKDDIRNFEDELRSRRRSSQGRDRDDHRGRDHRGGDRHRDYDKKRGREGAEGSYGDRYDSKRRH